MVATKQTYSITPTWTAAQLASLFESAFIDAGLMTAWHDSFLSGSIENRILKVEYDNTKTYGSTYYWFMFSTSGAFLHVATGWNTTTKVPTGTQYLDYFATTTNSSNNHWHFFSASTSNSVELVRYTSGDDADQSWFTLKSSTVRTAFTIVNAAKSLQPWLDLGKGSFAGFFRCLPRNDNSYPGAGAVSFTRGPSTGRDLIIGAALNGATTAASYSSESANIFTCIYGAVGNASNSWSANSYTFAAIGAGNPLTRNQGAILLPVNFSGTNPAFTSNSNPVFHSMPYQAYTIDPLPLDFGLTFHYATNSFSQGDTFVVDSGVEEWEVIDYAANNSAITGASPLFLARTV